MSQLPAVPFGMRISPELEEYLTAFRREIEAELDARPELQGGVLIVTPDKPLQVWKDGVFYSFGEDVIPPMLGASDRASQGGNLAETDNDNTFTGGNTFTSVNTFEGETVSTFPNGLRLWNPSVNFGYILRKDSGDFHLLQTTTGVPGSNWTTARPVRINDATGRIELNRGGNTTQGIWVGSATGGAQAQGTINAEAVYDDGTLLTDYVFDAALDGQIDIAAYDEATPDRVERCEDTGKELKREVRTHGPARAFRKCMDELDPAAFEAKWRESRKLPAVARCPEKPSLGQLAQALLETCEVQAVHIAKLEARLRALEERAQ